MSAFASILVQAPKLIRVPLPSSWLKPHIFSGSPSTAVGSPWEIFRPPPSLIFPPSNATDDNDTGGHTVTIISKDGAAYGYHARISLLDEYGLGVAVLTAGDQGALAPLLDALYARVIPAIDAAAREQAAVKYAGTFQGAAPGPGPWGNDSTVATTNASATLAMDGHSLRLVRLSREGRDILAALGEIWRATAGQFLPPEMGELTGVYRLYPAEVERERTLGDGRRVVEEDWRLEWGIDVSGLETDLPGRGISDGDCRSWALADWMHYGQQPVDRFVFVRDAETAEVIGLEVPFLRTAVMKRVVGR